MKKLVVARWFSVVVLGALAVGCGNRSDRSAVSPAACAPPAVTAPATVSAAAPPAASPAASPSAVAAASPSAAVKSADKSPARPAKARAEDVPLKVKRLVVAQGIERSKREPVGEKASFKASDVDKLYAFIEVENPEKADSEVFVTFEPQGEGASQGQVSLKVGAAPRWRTWAFTRGAKKPGKWAAIVRSADGAVLARTPFEVTL